MSYEQKKVAVLNGKKYAIWEETTSDHDVVTMELAEITAECPICGCVSADRNPFAPRIYLNGAKLDSEFVKVGEKTICRDCVEGSGDYYKCAVCEDWLAGKAHAENVYGESLCEQCAEYGKRMDEKEKRYAHLM